MKAGRHRRWRSTRCRRRARYDRSRIWGRPQASTCRARCGLCARADRRLWCTGPLTTELRHRSQANPWRQVERCLSRSKCWPVGLSTPRRTSRLQRRTPPRQPRACGFYLDRFSYQYSSQNDTKSRKAACRSGALHKARGPAASVLRHHLFLSSLKVLVQLMAAADAGRGRGSRFVRAYVAPEGWTYWAPGG